MFGSYKLNSKGVKDVDRFKTAMSKAISRELAHMPEGREKAIFKTKIEEAVFYGTKAVASKIGNFDGSYTYAEYNADVPPPIPEEAKL